MIISIVIDFATVSYPSNNRNSNFQNFKIQSSQSISIEDYQDAKEVPSRLWDQ